jgi:uncharacterized membrane protein
MMEHGRGNDFYWQEGARHAHDGWWGGPLHFVVLLLLLALLVAAVVWLVRKLAPAAAATTAVAPAAPAAAAALDPAVTTLRMRYARGEVSREDFQHTLADLTGAKADTAAWPGSTAEAGDEATPPA